MGKDERGKPLIRFIITHVPEHVDELLAEWLLRRFGHRKFSFEETGPQTIYASCDDEARKFLIGRERETIVIGMLGGRFDEHRADGRIPNTTSADLVARFLGIHKWQELQILLNEIRRADTQGGQSHLELGQLLKTMAGWGTIHPDTLTEFVFAAFDAQCRRQMEFHHDCPKTFREEGTLKVVGGYRVALVTSDLRGMNGWCRLNEKADIIVQFRSDGHAQFFITTTPRNKAGVREIARWIMRYEAWQNGDQRFFPPELETEFNQIVASGKGRELPAAGHWYYFLEAGMLLNGSTTHQGVPATKLTAGDIEQCVIWALSDMPKS